MTAQKELSSFVATFLLLRFEPIVNCNKRIAQLRGTKEDKPRDGFVFLGQLIGELALLNKAATKGSNSEIGLLGKFAFEILCLLHFFHHF